MSVVFVHAPSLIWLHLSHKLREKAFGAKESFRDIVKQGKITVQYCFTTELERSTHNKNSSPALGVTVPCSQPKKRMIQNWVNFDTFVV